MRSTGIIISRTLEEAGLKPEIGLQVMWKDPDDGLLTGVYTIKSLDINENEVILSRDRFIITDVDISELRTLLIEYCAEKECMCIDKQGSFKHGKGCVNLYVVLLNTFQWQKVIDTGLVDSGKQVWFKKESINRIMNNSFLSVATLREEDRDEDDDPDTLAHQHSGIYYGDYSSSPYRVAYESFEAGYKIGYQAAKKKYKK